MGGWHLLLCGCAVTVGVDARLGDADVERAKTKIPRTAFKGVGQTAMSRALNGHLLRKEQYVQACDDWTPLELQEFMGAIEGHRNRDLQAIYESAHDRRRLTIGDGDYITHWRRLNTLVEANPQLIDPQRDAHCREAVMWWTHHLTEEKRIELRTRNITVPLLPPGEKRPCGGSGGEAEEEVCVHLEQANSCDWCHSTQAAHDAGVPGTSMPNALKFTDGPDDGNPHGWDRLRRCDQDQLPRCKPCEGIGGHAYGDKNDQIDLVECSVVSLPNQTNMSTVRCTRATEFARAPLGPGMLHALLRASPPRACSCAHLSPWLA